MIEYECHWLLLLNDIVKKKHPAGQYGQINSFMQTGPRKIVPGCWNNYVRSQGSLVLPSNLRFQRDYFIQSQQPYEAAMTIFLKSNIRKQTQKDQLMCPRSCYQDMVELRFAPDRLTPERVLSVTVLNHHFILVEVPLVMKDRNLCFC